MLQSHSTWIPKAKIKVKIFLYPWAALYQFLWTVPYDPWTAQNILTKKEYPPKMGQPFFLLNQKNQECTTKNPL